MEKLYWVWLQTALGCGNAAADFIVKQELSPKQLYNSSEEELCTLNCLTPGLVKKLKQTSLARAEKIIRQCEALEIWLMTPDDLDYPQRLKNIYQVPLVLYGLGRRDVLSKDLLITMVGSRRATVVGTQSAYDLAQDLVQYGFGVVSGMALGIDSCCHQGALDMGGDTIGVAGCGLNYDYPNGNQALRRRIASEGAIISEYPPGEKPLPNHFPVRNRIVSGLSLGTVVVEASAKSGTLITANLALDQGRDVFALPTDIYNSNGQGNLRLIGQGATVVLSAETIVEEYSALYGDRMSKTIESRLNLRKQGKQQEKPEKTAVPSTKTNTKEKETPKQQEREKETAVPEGLSPVEQKILACLGEKTLHIEEICERCGMDMQETLVILSELEIDGLIRAYPGKQFGR